ncbi:MAG: hypothetical protein EON58_19855 [Alphaproteobacteria bacterium]|nr:MAG: hypothetical protein EON58_19855 [Alphaproteobacteria bacterium]
MLMMTGSRGKIMIRDGKENFEMVNFSPIKSIPNIEESCPLFSLDHDLHGGILPFVLRQLLEG